jgi:alpha-tubulin suppressor-like RCC1 family protein
MRRAAVVTTLALCLPMPSGSAGCTTRAVLVRDVDAGPRDAGSFEPRIAVAMGVDHACALLASRLQCAGANADGQLGLRDRIDRSELTPIDGRLRYLEVALGYQSSAVLTAEGDVLTFGDNARGQLGRGEVPGGPVLERVALAGLAVRVTQRFEHGCAILRTGALWCWGSNFEGELGQGDPPDSRDRGEPVEVSPGTAFSDVSAGQGHTCAIAIDGTLWCWGRNTGGELGVGPGMPIQIRRPTAVPGDRFRSVVAGQGHTCAIRVDGDLFCWGQDRDADGHPGPLGLAGSGSYDLPTSVDDRGDWDVLSSDTFHTCGVRTDGTLWCWGRNAEGQLGLGDTSLTAEAPTRVGTDSDWARVAVGRFSTCAQKRDGRVLCAGANRSGELGVGDTERRAGFTPAAGPG